MLFLGLFKVLSLKLYKHVNSFLKLSSTSFSSPYLYIILPHIQCLSLNQGNYFTTFKILNKKK